MKITFTIARIILGLLFFVSGMAYFLKLLPEGELSGDAQLFISGIFASGYLMPLVKSLEVICGLALLLNRFAAVAIVVIFPITVNVVLFHAFLAPEGIAVPVILLLVNLLLAFAYRQKYTTMLSVR